MQIYIVFDSFLTKNINNFKNSYIFITINLIKDKGEIYDKQRIRKRTRFTTRNIR